jgi:hypothetical protein
VNTESHVINLLIVKNTVYANLAKVCVESFLFYNPNCAVILHCDSTTYSKTVKIFRGMRQRVRVQEDVNQSAMWQESKSKILLSMSGTDQIFMDADLRWNGPLPKLQGVTFFTEEFHMTDKSPERQVIRVLEFLEYREATMKNTSFLFLGSFSIDQQQQEMVISCLKDFDQIISSADLGKMDYASIIRLKEQIIFSLISESWKVPIFFLKETDSHKDGRFVESSYFGATGGTF